MRSNSCRRSPLWEGLPAVCHDSSPLWEGLPVGCPDIGPGKGLPQFLRRGLLSLLLLLFLLLPTMASAGVPSFITYSGRLTDGTGWGESTQLTLTFRIYDHKTDGAKLWEHAFPEVVVQDGYFSVMLGEGTGPDGAVVVTDVFAENDQTWICVVVDGEDELAPRQPVGSVPYAINCRTLGGQSLAQVKGTVCGGVYCPSLDGYDVDCNLKQHCEYVNQDDSGWRQWDVWIYVPPGVFWMGSTGEGGSSDETPVHSVSIVDGYFISKYEIVVKQYEACMSDGGTCSAPSTEDWDGNGWGTNMSTGSNEPLTERPDHPQNGLTWQQAKDFCEWVAPGGRLPSESEWEYAATGPVHMKYPWGDQPDPTCDNNTAVFNEAGGTGGYGCGQGGTWPVGSKPAGASWCGALDMSGNLWEWCEDWWHGDYNDAPADGSAWVDPTGSNRVLRGGSFHHAAVNMRSAKRSTDTPSDRNASLGARCLRPLP